jgi:60S ribosomal protein uL30
LPGVEETILKRRKQNDRARAKSAKASLRNKKPQKAGGRIAFKRAEKLIKEFRLRQKDSIRLSRQARWHRKDEDDLPSESKLVFVIRIRQAVGMNARSVRALKLLRLNRVNSGTFLKLNMTTLNLLRVVEPYVTWGYPNLKTVRDMMYKHGYGSVDGKRTPLTSNADIEKMLGRYDIICLEDIIHEIMSVGPHFKEVVAFLYLFKLNKPAGGWKKKRTAKFSDGGECGARGDKINELLKNMI